MDVIEFIFKQNLLDSARVELDSLIKKHNAGEEISKEEVTYLLHAMYGMVDIIQEEILDPAREELKDNPFFQAISATDGPLQ